ncbi:unnamed protein product [Ranitomeya imitator]|uniref:Uncharacterized protein n=1 Tax=Ranitomeya imitator TaxID=111125 RepID=A0ABN9KVR0_9NEOB|nr:unnamed protein product [Ranitomeya imitator]
MRRTTQQTKTHASPMLSIGAHDACVAAASPDANPMHTSITLVRTLSALLKAEQSTAVRRRWASRTFPGTCALQYFALPSTGQIKYACAGATTGNKEEDIFARRWEARDSDRNAHRTPPPRAIFAVLDLMKLDMANFAISSIRPHLMQQSVEYEREKFQDFFEKQPNSLELVTSWIQETAELLAKNSVAASSSSLCPTTVLNHAYIKLVTWDHECKPFPETLVMDQIRFQELKIEATQLTLLGTLLLIIQNSTSGITSHAAFMDRMKSLIRILLEGVGSPSASTEEVLATVSEKICVELSSYCSQHGYPPVSAEREASLRGQIRSAASPANHIHRLIGNHVCVYIEPL